MSDCCSTNNKSSTNQQNLSCPTCHEKGKSVDTITLKSLLKPDAMKRLDSSHNYQFCRTADCPVVYFCKSVSFRQDEIVVLVFQKENLPSTPVCYCFGFDRKALVNDVNQNGKSSIQEKIKQYVKDKKCACEIRNPQGSCCLGNISQVVNQSKVL
ncbi:MAG: copper chaperone Copz family protein [Candidatus Omnitrophica bacterium]|nr:copper chaperone Copz family protein [Candidatus Omnitrophota bacterium]